MLVAGSALIFSLWVSVCAAAPEYIWQGLAIAFRHPSLDDALSALLLGLILAFFVEPLAERARHLFRQGEPDTEHRGQTSVFFTIGLSLAFALGSVCLHEAMSAFITGRNSGPASSHSALVAGLSITIGWAIVPFAVAIAWLSARNRWLSVPLGVVAAASPCLAGFAFSWSTQGIINTAIPCLVILALGYHRILRQRGSFEPSRLARIVAVVGIAWLGFIAVIDIAMQFFHMAAVRLYPSAAWYCTDLRFYFGWTLGLLLASPPILESKSLKHSNVGIRKKGPND
jgi:hypothetical protein